MYIYIYIYTILNNTCYFAKSQNHFIRDKFIFASLVFLKCSMDVQGSDGRVMLLKYVTSYVTKMQDYDIINGTMLKFKTILHYFYLFF